MFALPCLGFYGMWGENLKQIARRIPQAWRRHTVCACMWLVCVFWLIFRF